MISIEDKINFKESCVKTTNPDRIKSGVGTLSEKSLHAILKHYYEKDESNHEIRVGNYIADIVGEKGIIEIQTRNFDKLRKKLESFLEANTVTIVYPVAETKWLLWIDEETGEITKKRRSPKKGTTYDVFFELYKIKPYLTHPNLKLRVILLDMEEYRNLNGWSLDKKKGSSRHERIPVDISDELFISNVSQYSKFIPDSLPIQFTSKEYKTATLLNMKNSQTALHVLHHVGAVNRVGKIGNLYLYSRSSIY